jgi:hypothetical protein
MSWIRSSKVVGAVGYVIEKPELKYCATSLRLVTRRFQQGQETFVRLRVVCRRLLGALGSHNYRHDQPERTDDCEDGSVLGNEADDYTKQGQPMKAPPDL